MSPLPSHDDPVTYEQSPLYEEPLWHQPNFCQGRTRCQPIMHLLSPSNVLNIIPCRVLRSASQAYYTTVPTAHVIYHTVFGWTRPRTLVKWASIGYQFHWPLRAFKLPRYELYECPPSDKIHWQYGVRQPTSSSDSEYPFTVFMPPFLTQASPKVPAEQQGNQSQVQFDGHRTPGNTQYIPIGPGPPRLERHAPAIPVCPPSLSSRARTAFLTAPLTTGSAQ
jgi:hypothetical protein